MIGDSVHMTDVALRAGFEAGDYPNLVRIDADPAEFSSTDRRRLSLMLQQLETIRKFERWLVENEEVVHGPVHSSIGQEAVAVGVCAALAPSDKITSTHRAHHHFLAKAMSYCTPADYDPLARRAPPEQLVSCVRRTLAEILGLEAGWAGGRGGSMHLSDIESGIIGTTAIVGGGIPIAAGVALAERLRDTDHVAVAFFGDGTVSIGSFHEGISLARVWRLPAIFVIDNNLYSVATSVRETAGFEDLAIRAAGYDIPGVIVDGMDPMAVRRAVRLARQYAATGFGPVLVEAKTYRYLHQSGGLPGSALGYRTKEEEAVWLERDPAVVYPAELLSHGVLSQEEIDWIQEQASSLIDQAVDACTTRDGDQVVIRPKCWPDPSDSLRGVRSDGHEFSDVLFNEPDDFPETEEMSFVTAISKAIHRSMERDPEVFVIGEEVGHLRGGAYQTTRDAYRDFPQRLLDTPICENGFCGAALGAAIVGMRPIVEIMFPDFALEAADQLFNHIAKARYMYGGRLPIPVVVRTRTGQARGHGPQHSSDPAALFGLFPGWRIVAPATPADYIGLFNAAMISEDPVLIIEHHRLWKLVGPVPRGNLDYIIPLGKARVRRQGSDVTVVAWSDAVHRVLRIGEELVQGGVEAEVIDLRTLDRNSIDTTAIRQSVGKTGSLVIVEDAARSHSIGQQIVDQIQVELFDFLRQPIMRVTAKDVPSPVSKALEDYVVLSDEEIRLAIHRAASRSVASRPHARFAPGATVRKQSR